MLEGWTLFRTGCLGSAVCGSENELLSCLDLDLDPHHRKVTVRRKERMEEKEEPLKRVKTRESPLGTAEPLTPRSKYPTAPTMVHSSPDSPFLPLSTLASAS